ncbi:MAG TPA: hypothetical protein VFS43_00685 [Polyangiaceae bacterium]|nr:hypothetical protein [Polyangiaceae bacterium]
MPLPFWDEADERAYVEVPETQLSPFDRVFLGGKPLPGLSKVTGEGFKAKLDVKNPKGAKGAKITDNGTEPPEFTIELTLWTKRQWLAYQALVPAISPKPGKGLSDPMTIDYPTTSLHGIAECCVKEVGLGELERGAMKVAIKCVHWQASYKPTGSKTAKNAKGAQLPPTVLDERNRAHAEAFRKKNPDFVGPAPEAPPSVYDVDPSAK